jgi:hypothetical protein
MSFVAALRKRLGRPFAGALALLVVSAVPALGLTTLGPDLVSAWKGDAAEPALTGGADEGPLTFDAPASTVLREGNRDRDAGPAPGGEDLAREAAVLGNWKPTGATSDPVLFNQRTKNIYAAELLLNASLLGKIPADQFNALVFFEIMLNQNRRHHQPHGSPHH